MNQETQKVQGQQIPSQLEQYSTFEKDQLLTILKQTLKENKILQNKNTKLQTKYVELFKEHRAIKKDHATFILVFKKISSQQENIHKASNQNKSKENKENGTSNEPELFEQPFGSYESDKIQNLLLQRQQKISQEWRLKCNQLIETSQRQQKQFSIKLQAQEKESSERIVNQSKELQSKISEMQQELEKINRQNKLTSSKELAAKIKITSEEFSKQINSHLKEIQSLKKQQKIQNETIIQLQNSLEAKNNQLSKVSKEKLKIEHSMNNLKKQEISKELDDAENGHQKQMKLMQERNQLLAMRQQVQYLLCKRDELKKQLKERDEECVSLRLQNEKLSKDLILLTNQKIALEDKLSFFNDFTEEDLELLVVKKQQALINGSKSLKAEKYVEIHPHEGFEPQNLKQKLMEQSSLTEKNKEDFIPREYLKNIFVRYIKTESLGTYEQSITLLEIITTLLRFDKNELECLSSYKTKKKQWWYIY